jgi:dTDP-4-dehydrorhamnose reductase
VTSTWLITGAGGMLGKDLMARLAADREQVVGLARGDLDITDPDAVHEAVAKHRPDVIVNCAAWTAVDDAEAQEAEALRINGHGPRNLAAACAETGARLLQVYAEDAPTAPRSAYGRTKLAGEQAVLAALPDSGYVVRTAWLYGADGGNFVRTMIKLESVKDTLDVVDDQRGQPTWTVDLADRLVRLGRSALHGVAPAGIYHGTSSGEATWFDLAREIFGLLGADTERVRPTTSAAYPRPAPRPSYSVLGHDRWAAAGVEPIRGWREALHEAFPAMLAAERP